jgi:hypothetical protein
VAEGAAIAKPRTGKRLSIFDCARTKTQQNHKGMNIKRLK